MRNFWFGGPRRNRKPHGPKAVRGSRDPAIQLQRSLYNPGGIWEGGIVKKNKTRGLAVMKLHEMTDNSKDEEGLPQKGVFWGSCSFSDGVPALIVP